jgi:heme-degrading monooxygenase HmoA
LPESLPTSLQVNLADLFKTGVGRPNNGVMLLAHVSRAHLGRRERMEIVLIDKFVVPEASKARFLQEVQRSAAIIKTLPGFVEGFVYEKTGDGTGNAVVTTAVWKDEDAFRNAKQSAAEEFRKIGFDPAEIMKSLNVEIERAVYRRTPY